VCELIDIPSRQSIQRSLWSPLFVLVLGLGVAKPLVASAQFSPTPSATAQALANAAFLRQGSAIQLNGRTYPAAWAQWQNKADPTQIHTGISDGGLVQGIGLELLNTNEVGRQPAQWFAASTPLRARLSSSGGHRYLDIQDLAQQAGWRMQAAGDVLQITSPRTQVQAIRLGEQPWGTRIVLDLDRPAPWQMTRLTNSRDGVQPRELVVSVDATADPQLLQTLKAKPGSAVQLIQAASTPGRTTVQLRFSGKLRPQLSTLSNPNRLLIDLRPDPVAERDILWAEGLRWREQVVSLGTERFPVTWLVISPRQPGLKLQPIWSDNKTLVGTVPLATMAQRWQAAAAINGGFFNRDTQLPLGAIRQNNRWVSSPILNRGAIAWNEARDLKLGRLTLQQTLITPSGQRLPVLLNSGYVQKGIARYTPEWGATYTPLTSNEGLAVVQNNQVVSQLSGGPAGKTAFPIPANGYLLVSRSVNPAPALPIGTILRYENTATPVEFNRYPQILGAGPVLLHNRQIVLDTKVEQFRPPFDRQLAPRSAIGQTADGKTLMVAVHNRIGGAGPSLKEMAQLMLQLGAVEALNLDGGSSTTLYLGGQLLDRHANTAVRVHNGIGIFVQPDP